MKLTNLTLVYTWHLGTTVSNANTFEH